MNTFFNSFCYSGDNRFSFFCMMITHTYTVLFLLVATARARPQFGIYHWWVDKKKEKQEKQSPWIREPNNYVSIIYVTKIINIVKEPTPDVN